MKQYISPKSRIIELSSESKLLTGSDPTFYREEGEGEFSNKRRNIWGEEY